MASSFKAKRAKARLGVKRLLMSLTKRKGLEMTKEICVMCADVTNNGLIVCDKCNVNSCEICGAFTEFEYATCAACAPNETLCAETI
jgi:hypothetical protein